MARAMESMVPDLSVTPLIGERVWVADQDDTLDGSVDYRNNYGESLMASRDGALRRHRRGDELVCGTPNEMPRQSGCVPSI
jgi:hypothetical protein